MEGPRRRVFQRIEEIIADQSQRGIRILREEPIRHRRFSNWTFGSLPGGQVDPDYPSEFLWTFCARLE